MKQIPQTQWVVALTGTIASGKSTALAYFRQNGAAVFSADEAVAALYQMHPVQKKILALLGTLDKQEIAARVFADKQKRRALEKLLHPLVRKQLRAFVKKDRGPLAVVEIPLLFESGWQADFDFTIVVAADPATLEKRLKSRGLTRAQYQARIKYQWPEEKKFARADAVVFHRTKTDLKTKINRLCKLFVSLQQARS